MWNEEREAKLETLWREGWSASVIAGRLGGVTRNAVIGKLNRRGLTGRSGPSIRKTRRPRVLKRKIHLPKVREAAPPVQPWKTERAKLDLPRVDQPIMADAPSLTPQRILTARADGVLVANDALNSTCCRWPIGDPQDAAFHFCGGSAVAGLPYCQGHAVRAYKAPLVSRSQTADYNRQRGASVFGRGRAMTLV